MSAEPRRPRPDIAARSCKTGVILAIVIAALGGMMAVAGPTAAELQASNLSGRWTQVVADSKRPCTGASCRLTYDLVRCGEGWCGIEVKDGKECGRTALRLTAGPVYPSGVE